MAADDRGWNLKDERQRCQSVDDVEFIRSIPVRGNVERAPARVAIGERGRMMRWHIGGLGREHMRG